MPTIQPIGSTAGVDKSLGLLSVIAPRVRQLRQEHVDLQQSMRAMSERVVAAERPVVFLEGITDCKIFEHAKKVLGFEALDLRFESANGASDITAFLKLSCRIKPDDRQLIGVYDADTTGRKEFDGHKSVHKVEGTEFRILDKAKRIYVGILCQPNHLDDAQVEFKKLGVNLPLCIEFMFTKEILDLAIAAGALRLQSRVAKIGNQEPPMLIKIEDVADVSEEWKYLCKEVDDQFKTRFADWIVKREASDFEPLRATLADIEKSLQ